MKRTVVDIGWVASVSVYVLVPPVRVSDGFVAQAENGLVELLIGPTCASTSILVTMTALSGVKAETSLKVGSSANGE